MKVFFHKTMLFETFGVTNTSMFIPAHQNTSFNYQITNIGEKMELIKLLILHKASFLLKRDIDNYLQIFITIQ